MTNPITASASVAELDQRVLVPDGLECVVVVWREDKPKLISRLRDGELLVVGRSDRIGVSRVDGRTLRVDLPADKPYLSREHLVVHNTKQATHVHVLGHARNPGRSRHWGELNWHAARAGARLDSHDGLLAVQLPDRPPWLLTAVWGQRPAQVSTHPTGGSEVTRAESALYGIDLQPAQQDAIVNALMDAVRWPPPAGNGTVRSWRGDADRMAYYRLCQAATNSLGLSWQDSGQRGADPALLTALIESGSLDYAAVRRGHPWQPGIAGGLIPTHVI